MLTEKKALAIAKCWNEHKGKEGVAALVSKELKVGGREVGQVYQMCQEGLITFDAEGNPKLTVEWEQIEGILTKRPKRMLTHEQISRKSVTDTVKHAIADEAKISTEQYMILGKAVWQAYAQFCAKKGISIDEMRHMPIHKVVLESLEDADQLPLEQEANRQLTEELNFYRNEVNPLVRLRKAVQLLNEFMQYAVIADSIGMDVEVVIPHYEKLLTNYLKGLGNVA